MSPRIRSLIIYSLKNVTGVALSFIISYFVHWIDFAWCLISTVLVLSPEGNDAVPLAMTRIKANLIGAMAGAFILLVGLPTPYNMAGGAVISLIACDLLELNAGAKSTLAAMIIVLMHNEGPQIWDAAIGRIISVFLGCALGWAITYLFHSIFKIKTPAFPKTDQSGGGEKEG